MSLSESALDPVSDVLPEELRVRLVALMKEGSFLQAYALLPPELSLTALTEPRSCLAVGTLAMRLGASRLGNWLLVRAYRHHRDHWELRTCYVRITRERKGPLPAWNLMQRLGTPPEEMPAVRSEWFALQADLAGTFRDFETADELLDRAERLTPEDPWVWVERADMLIGADRYAEAWEAAEQALRLRPD